MRFKIIQKNPIYSKKIQKNPEKSKKNHWNGFLKKKPDFFQPWYKGMFLHDLSLNERIVLESWNSTEMAVAPAGGRVPPIPIKNVEYFTILTLRFFLFSIGLKVENFLFFSHNSLVFRLLEIADLSIWGRTRPKIWIWHRRSPSAAAAGATAVSADYKNLKKVFTF